MPKTALSPTRRKSFKMRSAGSKTNKPKKSTHQRPKSLQVNGVKKSPEITSAIPAWAITKIFGHAPTLAWEGTFAPLEATAVYPTSSPLLANLACSRKNGNWRWQESIHPLDISKVARFFSSITDISSGNNIIEYRLVDKQGAFIWIRHIITDINMSGSKKVLRGVVSDIHTEKEYQLESLRISEREQNRIGQDLHDDLCQVLAGLSCLTRVFEARMSSKVPEEVPTLKEINQQLVDAMQRTRALTHGLFPGKVQIADIRGALLELAAQIRARFQVEIESRFLGRFHRHTNTQIIQIYRLAQEAISNAIKHGRARRIEIALEAHADHMHLNISDDGGGLANPEAAASGIGLHIMRYRAGILGGEFSICNGSEKGVVVSLRYPFEN